MAYFLIEGLPPYDGTYEIEFDTFTNRELHTIKTLAGVRAGELEEAADAGDTDLVVAFAVIALQRAGLKVDPEAIWNADVGQITLVDEEASEIPPPKGENKSEPTGSSGVFSPTAGEPPANGQSRTGSPPSAPSVSDPQTLVN